MGSASVVVEREPELTSCISHEQLGKQMVYALNVFNLVPGRENDYTLYSKRAAKLTSTTCAGVSCRADRTHCAEYTMTADEVR